jgi:hypothetical protein
MDPGGRALMRDASLCALFALLVPILGWLLWALVFSLPLVFKD